MKRLLPILLMALLVGACGSTPASESPSVSPTASPVAEVSPTPTQPTPTPAPTPAPSETVPFAIEVVAAGTPIYLDSWWEESCDISCEGRSPEIASDGTMVYFLGSTATPITDENDPNYTWGSAPPSSYQLFVYDPASGEVRSAKLTGAPFGLGTPTISAAAGEGRPTWLDGACFSSTEKPDEFYQTQGDVNQGNIKTWPFASFAYSNGELGELGSTCVHYNSPYLRFAYDGVKKSPYADLLPCMGAWRCDSEIVAEKWPGTWVDLYTKGHPAAVCPPGEPKCDLSARVTRISYEKGKKDTKLTGISYGPFGLYDENGDGGLAFYSTRELYDGGGDVRLPLDELRYYVKATGTTGSVRLDGKALNGGSMALLIDGQIYMAVRPFKGGNSVLVRIDPANPGVATAITVAP